MHISRHSLAAVARAMSASGTIGPEGGTISLPSEGITLTVPKGTCDTASSYSIVANRGTHGFDCHLSPAPTLPFAAPVRVEIRAPGVDENDVGLCHLGRDGQIDEVYRCTRDGDNLVAHVPHFSGYILASGINAGEPCDPTVVTDGSCVWVEDNLT